MGPSKEIARGKPFFALVDPAELGGLDDWAEWLHALRTGFCRVDEIDGELRLVEIRKLVGVIDRGIRVEIHPDEHPPPHFHVKSDSLDAAISIEDCQVLQGFVSAADLRVIRYWHGHAKDELVRAWNETRPGDCLVGAFRST